MLAFDANTVIQRAPLKLIDFLTFYEASAKKTEKKAESIGNPAGIGQGTGFGLRERDRDGIGLGHYRLRAI